MKAVGSYEAKTHFAKLLDRVCEGESIVIKRRGHPVAVISQYAVPAANGSLQASFAEFRQRHQISGLNIKAEDIQSAKLEGRR
ncbi:MAG: type II toxin-antitoxin system prevent-host-death family antitoxin [Verrucomicrobiota bacterium]